MILIEKLRQLGEYISWLYDQYSLITSLNILDAFERYIFNTIILLVLFICIYSTCMFLPNQLIMIYTILFGDKSRLNDELHNNIEL
jgi:hypothetical protein